MSDSVLQVYYDGDPVRRIPKRLTPDKSRVDFQVEWTGRPDWLSEEEAQHCNRIRKP